MARDQRLAGRLLPARRACGCQQLLLGGSRICGAQRLAGRGAPLPGPRGGVRSLVAERGAGGDASQHERAAHDKVDWTILPAGEAMVLFDLAGLGTELAEWPHGQAVLEILKGSPGRGSTASKAQPELAERAG